ncbi:TPA: hypothetical protein N0F65_001565 [Lagenidium giganteum]|uniref:Nucleotide-diphospho-sugar transferase n=1 Tax=Lagenidium giganteum TaxID=4803 RepID=A0AAV2YH32_9STRA|nr:TPA: hypothetical protein N0F65_001565 [Lagenidium giganteum]
MAPSHSSDARRHDTTRLLRILAAAILVCVLLSLSQYQAVLDRAVDLNSRMRWTRSNNGTFAPPGEAMVPEPDVDIKKGSKGIIMCLHDRIIPLGASLIRELRCLGNQEHIEVYHCDELSADSVALLNTIDANVQVINICASLVENGVMSSEMALTFRSYWIKPMALHQTRFEEVILLDADDILLKDPAKLRSIDGYKANGTVFFYDRVIAEDKYFLRWVTPSVGAEDVHYLHYWLQTFDYARFGLEYGPSDHVKQSFAYQNRTCHEQDSSMVLVDKKRAGKAMSVLWFIMTEHRFNAYFSHGDKEAFWLAYELAHAPYFFSPWGASVVSATAHKDVQRYEGTLCGSLCHFMPVEVSQSELLYINGRALIDPTPFDVNDPNQYRTTHVFNTLPTHMTPRQERQDAKPKDGEGTYAGECNIGLGKTPVPRNLRNFLWRRRQHFMAITMGMLEPLYSCDMGSKTAMPEMTTSKPKPKPKTSPAPRRRIE